MPFSSSFKVRYLELIQEVKIFDELFDELQRFVFDTYVQIAVGTSSTEQQSLLPGFVLSYGERQ